MYWGHLPLPPTSTVKHLELIALLLVSFPCSQAFPVNSFLQAINVFGGPTTLSRQDPQSREHNNVILEYGNIKGGNSHYGYLPTSNYRIIEITNLNKFNNTGRENVVRSLKTLIELTLPITGDNPMKIRELELAVLSKGMWATCKWLIPLPYPLDKSTQCTQAELKYVLESRDVEIERNRG